jgi:hypothetical protein
MRLFLCASFAALLITTAVRAQDVSANTDELSAGPAPLVAALRAYAKDAPRWAYTQRFVQLDRKGAPKEQWLARYDPSQHYDVQWTLLERDGQTPTEAQQKKFRREREKLRDKKGKTLGELLDIAHASAVPDQPDAAERLTYEVPLRLEDDSRFPAGKFQVFVKLDRATGQLATIDVKLREKVRVALVASVKSADARIEFLRVRPDAGPAIARIAGGGSATVLFVPVGARVEATRTDFKRVTPYDDRFVVKPGPLRTIDF